TAPDGVPFPEALETRRFDAGAIGRVALGSGRVLALRASAMQQRHCHTFGSATERDRYRTGFAEAALTGTQGERATWVVGGAFQADGYNAADVPRFNYTYTVPGVFAQYDQSLAAWLRGSASSRLDVHSAAGTWLSPRVSLLLHRPGSTWSAHLSAGT